MDQYTATELAFKHGYEEGLKDAVKHGRWEKADNLKPKCSVCGEYHLFAWPDYKNCNYCPNCGAKMEGK